MGILLVIFSACCCSASNFCMRQGVDRGGTARAFLVLSMGFAALATTLLGPLRTGQFAINPFIIGLGILAGLVYGLMFEALGKALQKGPPGLTFSILSGATVFPAVVMSLWFGESFGYIYTVWHALGSLLVLAGLFWAGRGLQGMTDFRSWLFFAFAMFILHVCLLAIFQWRALLLHFPYLEGVWAAFQADHVKSEWFMPIMYGVATCMQAGLFLQRERRVLPAFELCNGAIGGIFNSVGTFFLIWATEIASSLENAILYPLFSVLIILFSNAWSQKIYRETVNWRACQICVLGLLVATVDWKGVLAVILR